MKLSTSAAEIVVDRVVKARVGDVVHFDRIGNGRVTVRDCGVLSECIREGGNIAYIDYKLEPPLSLAMLLIFDLYIISLADYMEE